MSRNNMFYSVLKIIQQIEAIKNSTVNYTKIIPIITL